MKLGKILGAALPVAAMFIPGIGPVISGALMSAGVPAGLAAAGGAAGWGALAGGVGAALGGHNVLKGAALGGLGGGLGSVLKGASALQALPSTAPAASPGIAGAIQATTPGVAEAMAGAGNATAGALASEAAQIGTKGIASAAPGMALNIGKKSILPMLALGGLGLAMQPPKYQYQEEENKNPNAGKEVQDPRVVMRPPSDFIHGGAGGEWMFFDPAQTTGAYHYANGGGVATESRHDAGLQLYNPAQFAGLFQRPVIHSSNTIGAYNGGNVGAYGTPVMPPKAAAPATPATPPVVNPQPDLSMLASPYAQYGLDNGISPIAFKKGGRVRGPGTGTSDSIPAIMQDGSPALLSNGEYVLNAHTVRHIGGGSTEHGFRKLDALQRTAAR